MRAPHKTQWPSASALWSLLWRAVVLMPLAVLFTGAWLGVWLALLVLPVWEFVFVADADWFFSILALTVWILLLSLARSRWFQAIGEDYKNNWGSF